MLLGIPALKRTKYRIGRAEAFFLIFFATGFDLLTIFPIIGSIVGWIFWFLFYMYLVVIRGFSLKASDLVTGGISSFVELFPVVQIFPTITLGVVRIILSTRRQDRKKALEANKKAKQETSAQNNAETSAASA